MDRDDELVGRLFSRREAVAILGASGLYLLSGCSSDGTTNGNGICVVRPALTEGPYFVDELLNRSDIRSDPSNASVKPGTQLALTVNVSSLAGGACSPLGGAQVDVWHCDAVGVYSDVSDPGFNTVGQKFLRGYQVTNADGRVDFVTIYPGWYAGRATHIHFKVRSPTGVSPGYEFTSQWFFDDSLSDLVQAQAPYTKGIAGRLQNNGDGIYNQGGSQLLLSLSPAGQGYSTSFNLAIQT